LVCIDPDLVEAVLINEIVEAIWIWVMVCTVLMEIQILVWRLEYEKDGRLFSTDTSLMMLLIV